MPPSKTLILPDRRSPFFIHTVSAREGVEAAAMARHNRVLDNIGGYTGSSSRKTGHYPQARRLSKD
ncbi:hypothetical protein TUM20286_50970 [Pseudomonas tohonis]|uniref:Uncharacterized protein n=1 Tax=Pseudomonas tohonis TaxID=2725477 RepID=A0ABQ4W7G9_9PSED|nr:hypothetical protein TUM20286_50970 [Pseudomonas tohonis]